MAITRTPIINDDGSLTVGTVFENAWKQELYDQIDGAIAAESGSAWANAAVMLQAQDGTVLGHNLIIHRYRRLGKTAAVIQSGFNPILTTVATPQIIVTTTNFPFRMTAPVGSIYPIAWAYVPAYVELISITALSIKMQAGGNWAQGGVWAYFSIVVETADW